MGSHGDSVLESGRATAVQPSGTAALLFSRQEAHAILRRRSGHIRARCDLVGRSQLWPEELTFKRDATSVDVLSLKSIVRCGEDGADMRRRDVITLASGATLAWLPFARAQQSSHKVWRLAFLNTDSWESEVQRALFEVFRDELQKLGTWMAKTL